MARQYIYEAEEPFLNKLGELVRGGMPPDMIRTYTPHPVHHVEEILREKASPLRFFTLTGAVTGCCFGFFLTIFSVVQWPIITGGKPLISIPTFIIIAFELTILLGAIASFIGFLILARLPSPKGLDPALEFGNRYVIVIEEEEERG